MAARSVFSSIVDRAVEHAKRFELTNISGDTYDWSEVPGTITAAGTELNAALFNPIISEVNKLSEFATDSVTGIDLSGSDYTLSAANAAKGTLVVDTASATYSLILPTTYNYRYVIYNGDSTNTLLVKKSGGTAVEIPPETMAIVAYDGNEYRFTSDVTPEFPYCLIVNQANITSGRNITWDFDLSDTQNMHDPSTKP